MKLDDSAIASLGASLRQINPTLMKAKVPTADDPTQSKCRFWYQGNELYFDVTVEQTGARLSWFQITLRGRAVFWQLPDRLQTGETDELDVPPQVAYYAASKTIRDGEQIDWSLVKAVQAILAHRPDDPVLTAVSKILKTHLNQQQEGSRIDNY